VDPHSDLPTIPPAAADAGPRIGEYVLRRKLGEGGMGEVWLADQQQPVRRRVAVKVIKLGMDTREVVARFEMERQALAVMEHPAIAHMLDAGVTPEGRPYFVMEYVSGEPFHAYCDRVQLGIPDRLRLFLQVCHAVQHAHQKAIIHRDLKPSNVLVAEHDGVPQPKVIDFGIAKAIGGQSNLIAATQYGAPIGTPEYMSPEQASGRGEDVDTRTDVYSLVVMLYELLTGAHPLDVETAGSLDELRRRIREQDPVQPSTRVRDVAGRDQIARSRATTPAHLPQLLKGDLNSIALKALEKDRNRRYGSPAELAADIERHLRHEPVLAHPPSAKYRATRFVRRHRFGVGVAAAAALILLAFSVGMGLLARELARERDRANQQAETSKRTTAFLKELFTSATPERTQGAAVTARELLDRGAARIEQIDEASPEVRADLIATIGDAYQALGVYSEAERLLKQSLTVDGKAGRTSPPSTVSNLAHALQRLGRHQESVDLLEPLVKRNAAATRVDDDVLQLREALGLGYMHLGRVGDGEALLVSVAATERELHGEQHAHALSAQNNLAEAYYLQGRGPEAMALDERTLQLRRQTLGDKHPSTLSSMNNLAFRYQAAGRFDDARKLLVQALSIGEQVYGPEHPEVGICFHTLGEVELAAGKYADATRFFQRSIAIYRRLPTALYLPLALYELAQATAMQGDRAVAVAAITEALKLGYKPTVAPQDDPHFKSLKDSPQFQQAFAARAAK
jgi:non-specific serine/threonine protein kinase/serine/threonine-protein kinase